MAVIEGVYTATGGAAPEFRELPPPNDGDVADVVCDAARRIQNLLERSGAAEDPAEADPLIRDQPALAELAAASVLGKTARGERQMTLGIRIDPEATEVHSTSRCASAAGYSLHADTSIPAGAPDQLERLFRYAGRPALAEERLSELPDGRLLYRLKRPWRDGTSSVVFEPADLMARLAALVPPPRAHAIHYYGLLAPRAAYRPAIVPCGVLEPAVVSAVETPTEAVDETHRAVARPRNYSWSYLLRKIFAIDVLACPVCAGSMKIIAAITQPEIASRILPPPRASLPSSTVVSGKTRSRLTKHAPTEIPEVRGPQCARVRASPLISPGAPALDARPASDKFVVSVPILT